jgi:molybdopterin-guanine dinucleotide biosynthesis protein A
LKQHSDLDIHAVILAGGKARRMQGQDKGLIKVHGRRLIDYAIEAAAPLAKDILISANRNIAEYESLGYPVYKDHFGDYAGPLAGILTALDMIREDALLLVLPCDMPALPVDMPELLRNRLLTDDADICCIRSLGRVQPLISLMHTRVHQHLHEFLQSGKHKVMDWVSQLHMVTADIKIDDHSLVNINTIEALNEYEQQSEK